MRLTSEHPAITASHAWWESVGNAVDPKGKAPEKASGGILARIKKLLMDQLVGEDPRPYGSDRFPADETAHSWTQSAPRAAPPVASPAPRRFGAFDRLRLTAAERAKIERETAELETYLELDPEEYERASRAAGLKLGMRNLPDGAIHPGTLAYVAHRSGADLRGLLRRDPPADTRYEGEPDAGLFDRSCQQKDAPRAMDIALKTSTWRKKKG